MILRTRKIDDQTVQDVRICGGRIKPYQVEEHIAIGFGWWPISQHNHFWQALRKIKTINRLKENCMIGHNIKLKIYRENIEYVLKTCPKCGDEWYAKRKQNKCTLCGSGLVMRTKENRYKNWDELKS